MRVQPSRVLQPTARWAYNKIATLDSLVRHRLLPFDHYHVPPELRESLLNALSRLLSDDGDLQLLMIQNHKALAGRLRDRPDERAAEEGLDFRGALWRLRNGLKRFWR